MSQTVRTPDIESYDDSEESFREYLHDLGDRLFPFPSYRDGQGEALREALDALYVDGYNNVILDLPTGVGKSPLNLTIQRVNSRLYDNTQTLLKHFGTRPTGFSCGQSFYTTPQKQLRNQLAEDADLKEYVEMLKARGDYTCGESGEPCDQCPVQTDPDRSCLEADGCTYWAAKMKARSADISALTFAMLIVDNNLPPETDNGQPLSFRDRDILTVDEGQGLEGQAAGLFAGFTISPWSLPPDVFGNAGGRADWGDDRYEDVADILSDVNRRAREFKRTHEDNPNRQNQVDKCENFLRKLRYARDEMANDRPWVVNVDQVEARNSPGKTKSIQLQPVYVDDFLRNFIWSRGTRRVISSATIPYRNKIEKWCDRIGLGGDTKLISKPMPFPVEHRLIHLNTIVGEMSGDDEDRNWSDAVKQIKKVLSKHSGEKGLVHTNSYDRAERLQDSLGSDLVMLQDQQKDKSVVIEEWQESDQPILASPSMAEGVDLYGDRCRWQALLKVPFGYVGDSRVSYLLKELHDWEWYYEMASMKIQQMVGRAVRGPEPEEAASFYVIDKKFRDVIFSRAPGPDWFMSAIRNGAPDHWNDPEVAPWR